MLHKFIIHILLKAYLNPPEMAKIILRLFEERSFNLLLISWSDSTRTILPFAVHQNQEFLHFLNKQVTIISPIVAREGLVLDLPKTIGASICLVYFGNHWHSQISLLPVSTKGIVRFWYLSANLDII